MKKTAFWGIFITTLACLSVILFERVLLWFSPQIGNFYEYDADLGFRVRPYTNDSNAFGFNDRDYPLQKPAGHFRIVVLGDSFSWAGGKDKNYTIPPCSNTALPSIMDTSVLRSLMPAIR
jgi:hypothetical protein